MDTVIQVAGWSGLVGALLGTVAVLKLALLILRVLRQIDLLVRLARDGAEGLRLNLEPLSRMPAADQTARALAHESVLLASTATTLAREVEPVASHRTGAV